MLYPIGIEMGDETHAYGVIVPDVPGCFSAGDTLEEAFENVREAIEFHIQGLVEDGEEVPLPTSLEEHRKRFAEDPDLQYFTFLTVVNVDITHLLGKAEKINITVPRHLLHKIDQFVAVHPEYKNRSSFLSRIAADKVFGVATA
ncbi:hypothetical protein A4G18_07505 [Pasteurellaceae bacterium Pebbles2]|nr:hypothetical protein [Pasteurellaceae bacterium Pebbles2]